MAGKIPVFKKKVNAFLTSEEGKITKQSMLIAGGILGTVAAGSIASKFAKAGDWSLPDEPLTSNDCGDGSPGQRGVCNYYSHKNSADYDHSGGNLDIAHNHHYNHGSHASHASHGSHGSCCLDPGTPVSMADKSIKRIEEIKVDDVVSVWDFQNKAIDKAKVIKLVSPEREGIYSINDGLLKITEDHPVLAKKSEKYCWAAIDKNAAKISYNLEEIEKLEISDFICRIDKNKNVEDIKIEKIGYITGKIKTYSFMVDKHHNFFGNKIIVHNGMGGCGGM